VRRREFIAGVGGVGAWSLAAEAQPANRVRRVSALIFGSEDEMEYAVGLRALKEGLGASGWNEGHNFRIDIRFADSNLRRLQDYAEELVALSPDVIVVTSSVGARTVKKKTGTIPMVFMGVGDPIADGLVNSIARPRGNATGFTNKFVSIGGKWLELLKEAAPRLQRVAVLLDAQIPRNAVFPFEESAAPVGVSVIRMPYRSTEEIERSMASFAAEPNGGLVLMPPHPSTGNRERIIRTARQLRLPTIYQTRSFAADGGLMSYGSDPVAIYRRASVYVDRILRGAKPSDLPVEFPTKFELVINLKTANALGLTVPETLLATADEVIQ
jgi:putative tryptophan/tyrosine transport system substrate-binding protein